MKLPLSLLKSFLDISLSLRDLSHTLTLLGIEVDSIEHETPPFEGVVVADVQSVAPHPNAAKLQIAHVFDGKRTHSIVCGAPNCRPGIKVPFAPLGAKLPGLTIQRADIRGVASEGMLCAADELGIPGSTEGLLELPLETPAGTSAASLLWDPVLELSFTPNLGHCLSALGIARELAAATELPLRLPALSPLASESTLKVEDPALCPRYVGRGFEHVTVGPSPFWLSRQLLNAGFKSISNVVDITNYLLLKWGQPLHAFDLDRLEGPLRVETLKQETPFLGLDDVERNLPKGALVIADSKGPVALAGIMGGAHSAVSSSTRRIFLEAASFTGIRKTAKHLGLRTESSLRFEKGVDPTLIPYVMQEATHLLSTLACATPSSPLIDTHPEPFERKQLTCRLSRVNQVIGTRLSLSELTHLFSRLDLAPHKTAHESVSVHVPLYRQDINSEIDLVEEAARLYGYPNIEKKSPAYRATSIPHDPAYLFQKLVRGQLVALGLQELLTSDLISPKLASLIPDMSPIRVLHAKSEEFSVLRPSLLPGLLQVASHNAAHQTFSLAAFEIGHLYFRRTTPVEVTMLAILLTGHESAPHWKSRPEKVDFYTLKGKIESFICSLKLELTCTPSSHPLFHPGRQAHFTIGGEPIGTLGELHPSLLESFHLKDRILYAELNLDHLQRLWRPHVRMEPLPIYPASERDWTVTIPPHTSSQPFLDALRTFPSPLLESYELLDLYDHPTGRNLTYRFVYRDPLKTISQAEVESVHAKLLQHLQAVIPAAHYS